MKKYWKILFIVALFCGTPLINSSISAQDEPPLPPDHGRNGDHPVGAPIDGGLGILLALGAAYGGMKLYLLRKKGKGSETKDE
jgi:hypothetical protein